MLAGRSNASQSLTLRSQQPDVHAMLLQSDFAISIAVSQVQDAKQIGLVICA